MYNKCELLPGEIDLFRSALKRRVLAYKPHYPLSPSLSLSVLSVCAAPSSSNHRSPRVSLSCLLGLCTRLVIMRLFRTRTDRVHVLG